MTTNDDTITPDTTEEALEVTEEIADADAPDEAAEDVQEADTPDASAAPSDEGGDDDADTFSRSYVEKLRQENGKYRQRAQHADALAHRLHRELVRSDGRLQDPTDLDFSDDHLADDGEALTAAIDDLLQRKPHLAARKVAGNVGQGATRTSNDVNLLGLLRGN